MAKKVMERVLIQRVLERDSGRRGHTAAAPAEQRGDFGRAGNPVGQLRRPTGDYICIALRDRRRGDNIDKRQTRCDA